jgi:MFS family permease
MSERPSVNPPPPIMNFSISPLSIPNARFELAVVMAVLATSASVVVAAVAAPLLIYSTTLATFGLAHVLSELRYVDRRFGRALGAPRILIMSVLLAGAVAARASGVFGLLGITAAVPLELGFVAALALSAARGSRLQRGLALGIAGVLGIATLAAPFDTAISLSILHNLTPLAFLWEISRPAWRWRIMLLALLVFVALPLFVATGLPRLALMSASIVAPSIDPLGAGPLADQLYVYVPVPLQDTASAIDLFSASVVAQCAHYAAVIFVLPAMLATSDPRAAGLVAWPRGRIFFPIIAVLSSLALYRFANGFGSARAFYGIAASFHAWVEIPLVIIAVTGRFQPNSKSPTSVEAPLAATETMKALIGDSAVTQMTIAASTTATTASVTPAVSQCPMRG